MIGRHFLSNLAQGTQRESHVSTRLLALAVALAGLTAAASAVAAAPPPPASMSVTATGSGLVKVVPRNRKSNGSILAAVAAARRAGITGALRAAHANAVSYAAAAGLTLGPLMSVSDVQNNTEFIGPYAGPIPFEGPFGVNRYCGIERRPVFKFVTKNGKRVRKLVTTKKIHACIVPPYEDTTLTVTYAAAAIPPQAAAHRPAG
jgi:hypothetical protein